MNETLLKSEKAYIIISEQVFPENYSVLRLDRSLKTHPFDSKQPKKFERIGAQAELLSVIFNTECGKSFNISTFYRVVTLGTENFEEVHKHK